MKSGGFFFELFIFVLVALGLYFAQPNFLKKHPQVAAIVNFFSTDSTSTSPAKGGARYRAPRNP